MTSLSNTMVGLVVRSIAPDRSTYKQYNPQFTPEKEMIVEVPVPSYLVREEDGKLILSLDGFTALLENIASPMYEMHKKFLDDEDNK